MEGDTDGEVWLVSGSGLTQVVVAGVEMTEVTEVTRGGRWGFLGHRLRWAFILCPNVKYRPQAGQWAGRWEGRRVLGLIGDSWAATAAAADPWGDEEDGGKVRGANGGRESWGRRLAVEVDQVRGGKNRDTGEGCRDERCPWLSERDEKQHTSVYSHYQGCIDANACHNQFYLTLTPVIFDHHKAKCKATHTH